MCAEWHVYMHVKYPLLTSKSKWNPWMNFKEGLRYKNSRSQFSCPAVTGIGMMTLTAASCFLFWGGGGCYERTTKEKKLFCGPHKTALHWTCTGRPRETYAWIYDVNKVLSTYVWANWIVHMVVLLTVTRLRHVNYVPHFWIHCHHVVLNTLSCWLFVHI
jgi:hypothetical protein